MWLVRRNGAASKAAASDNISSRALAAKIAIVETFGKRGMAAVSKLILDAANELIKEALPEDGALAAEQLQLHVFNTIDIMGATLHYYKKHGRPCFVAHTGALPALLTGRLPVIRC